MNTIKLMHGTSSSLLNSIQQNGLVPPTYSEIVTNRQTRSRDSIYLTNEYDYAKRFADLAVSKFGGERIIIVANVEIDKLLVDEDVIIEHLESDENGYFFDNDEDESKYYTKDEIDNLNGVDSLNIEGKCRYKGIIEPNNICHIEKC